MEEEAPSRRSVAELAGKFKDSAAPHDAAGQETEKPVRRRPPRSLQLAKPQGDEQEQPPAVTSPGHAKAKRNSALIEKLQASLVLSPTALLPSPKSPGFRLLPPNFTPSSPGSGPVPGPVTTATTSASGTPTSPVSSSPCTEEGPVSFEAPPAVGEGTILSNTNIKGRARHSIRRRPPSRRHRKSSNGDEVGVANEEGDATQSSPSEDKSTGGGGDGGGQGQEEEGGEVFKQEGQSEEVKEDQMDTSTCPDKTESHTEVSMESRAEEGREEKEDGSAVEKEGEVSSSGRKEEEEKEEGEKKKEEQEEKMVERKEEEEEVQQKNSEDLSRGATESKVEDMETTSECSVR